jgi:hypothetical protein
MLRADNMTKSKVCSKTVARTCSSRSAALRPCTPLGGRVNYRHVASAPTVSVRPIYLCDGEIVAVQDGVGTRSAGVSEETVADLHSKVCGFTGSGQACGNTRGLVGRTKNGSADCASIAFRFPSTCVRALDAETPRTLGSRSALHVLSSLPGQDVWTAATPSRSGPRSRGRCSPSRRRCRCNR